MKSRINEFDIFRRGFLKALTWTQKKIIHWDNSDLYYLLSRIHFKIWFGYTIDHAVRYNLDSSYMAARRHARLLVKTVYKKSLDEKRKQVYKLAQISFLKNISLSARL